jgi:hypothetical protein
LSIWRKSARESVKMAATRSANVPLRYRAEPVIEPGRFGPDPSTRNDDQAAGRPGLTRTLGHDPEKWKPVFGKDHAPTKNLRRSLRAHAAQRVEARLHLALEIILRITEQLVARVNEVALVLPQLRAVLAVAVHERRLVNCPDLAVEPRQIGIGTDRFLDREMRGAAIESRQHRTVASGRKAPVAFLARIGEVLRGLVELRIDAQRLLIIGNGAVEIALLAIGGAAIVVGECKPRIERDGAIVIGDGAGIGRCW